MTDKSEILDGTEATDIRASLEAIKHQIENSSNLEENINQEKYADLRNLIFPIVERFVGAKLERISLEESYRILNALKIMKSTFSREEFIRVFSSRKIDFTDFMNICDELNRAEQEKDFSALDLQISFMGEFKALAQSIVIADSRDSYGNLGSIA